MDWQLVASWVTAIGSAGSLLGFASYVWIMLLNRKDEAEVRQEQQAQGVSAWLDEGARHDRREHFVICLHNAGVSPVFSCKMLFGLPSSTDKHIVQLSIVPPGTTAVRGLPFDQDEIDREELYSAPAVPELRFTDTLGVEWMRDGNGRLYRLERRGPRRRPRLRHQQSREDGGDRSRWRPPRQNRQQARDRGV